MKTVIGIVLLLLTKFSYSQENAIDKYFKEFQEKNSLEVTTVSSKMFTTFLDGKGEKEKQELGTILRKLTGLKVLNKYGPKNGLELYKTACSLMPVEWETILTLNETDRNAKFYTKENKEGKIIELVMIAFQWERFLVVSITGDIILSDILKLSQNLNLEGFSDMQKSKTANQ